MDRAHPHRAQGEEGVINTNAYGNSRDNGDTESAEDRAARAVSRWMSSRTLPRDTGGADRDTSSSSSRCLLCAAHVDYKEMIYRALRVETASRSIHKADSKPLIHIARCLLNSSKLVTPGQAHPHSRASKSTPSTPGTQVIPLEVLHWCLAVLIQYTHA